jgi:hypothetical protein
MAETGLTGDDRWVIARSRELAPALMASGDVRQRLAAELLAQLADLAERLGGGDG